jgi:hypothetical protein
MKEDKKYLNKEEYEYLKFMRDNRETSCSGRYAECGMTCDDCEYLYAVHHYHDKKLCHNFECFQIEEDSE